MDFDELMNWEKGLDYAQDGYDKEINDAIDEVNEAYENEENWWYEELIDRYSSKFGYSYGRFEELCEDARG